MRRNTFAAVFVFALVAVLAIALVGCSSGSSSSGGTSSTGTSGGASTGSGGTSAGGTTITEEGFAFNPANVTVKVGDTVTFTNKDSAPHNVKIDGQELGSQNQGESKTWTASKAGSFPYSCVIHPSMTGVITVQ
jgi:plastocyanin